MRAILMIGIISLLLGLTDTNAVGDDLSDANTTPAEMRPIEVNGFSLIDAEYFPFIGSGPLRYPEDVRFGFYPEGTTTAARDCALVAFRQLESILSDNMPELVRAVALGATPIFYLWINDYTHAAVDRGRRPARVWHWSMANDQYNAGHWKWELTITQDGTCELPSYQDAQAAFAAATSSEP